jgi:transposase
VQRIAKLYGIEREARDLSVEQGLDMRQARAKPLRQEMHVRLQLERRRVPDGSTIANAIDYSLTRWSAFMANVVEGNVPIDNNHIDSLMRPWAMGRNNAKCPFMRSQRRGATCRPCGRWCGHFT